MRSATHPSHTLATHHNLFQRTLLQAGHTHAVVGGMEGDEERDGDEGVAGPSGFCRYESRLFDCPICVSPLRDASLTACGHTFCHACIMRRINEGALSCPSCAAELSSSTVYPNQMLSELLRKGLDEVGRGRAYDMTPEELMGLAVRKVRRILRGEDDSELTQLGRRPLLPRVDEALEELQTLRNQLAKESSATELQLAAEFLRACKQKRSARLEALLTDLDGVNIDLQTLEEHIVGNMEPAPWKTRATLFHHHDFLKYYLRSGSLDLLSSLITNFTQYDSVREVGSIDVSHAGCAIKANVGPTITLDRYCRLLATVSDSTRIHVQKYESLFRDCAEVPALEGATRGARGGGRGNTEEGMSLSWRSRLSCVCWMRSSSSRLLSGDCEGIISLWDVSTGTHIAEFAGHRRRVWGIDCSANADYFVGSSEDGHVKLWSTQSEGNRAALDLNVGCNVCGVRFNPASPMHVAVGGSDQCVRYYDLRAPREPLYIMRGHRKTVSYVAFCSPTELVSASTDSTLRVWDLSNPCYDSATGTQQPSSRILSGHTNERNFVGLDASSDYIVCGSEADEVFVFHKMVTRPLARRHFSATTVQDTQAGSRAAPSRFFVSSVVWEAGTPRFLAANTSGAVKVFTLACSPSAVDDGG